MVHLDPDPSAPDTADPDGGTLDALPPFPDADDVDPPQATDMPDALPLPLTGMFALLAALLLLGAVVLA